MKIYNSLSRKIEDFKPLNPLNVKMYACGPTVYDYQHIGHMRRYVGDDILVRILVQNGYKVKHVMNITDVGHLTSDSDTGEDKMEKGAKKLGLSVWDVAKKFEKQFFDSMEKINIKKPDLILHATDYIKQQIELIQELEKKGFTYKTTDGIYFDTSRFPEYGKLTGQKREELKAGARIEMIEDKKNLTDFALWKFSKPDEKRQMEWESPWGIGFPGWHIECSAMSMAEFGPTLDIHTGGIDHISIHHTNEIAQSEAASGREFVRYWVHHGFLLVEGEKMSKSLGNFYTVEDIMKNGFDPMALRYLYFQTHYRQEMNFTWEAMTAAQNALDKLRGIISGWRETPKVGCAEYEQKFLDAINDDLNTSQAIAIMWGLVHSGYPNSAKLESLYKMDEVLGLNLKQVQNSKFPPAGEAGKVQSFKVPDEVQNLIKEREELRREKKFDLADEIREKIKKLGYEIQDMESGGTKIKKSDR